MILRTIKINDVSHCYGNVTFGMTALKVECDRMTNEI